MEHYEFLLKKITNKLTNPTHKKYVTENLSEIVTNLRDFSKFFSDVVDISLENITVAKKITKLHKLKLKSTKLTKTESGNILDALQLNNIIGGGAKEKEIAALKDIHKSIEKNTLFCLTNTGLIASKVFSNLPKYGLLIASKFFSDLADLYNFDWHSFADFTKKLDWIYLYLFVLASLPITGVFFDMIIIMRSVKQGRVFLAILTFITSMVSMLVLHIVDIGLIIKLLYFLDVSSYTSTKNKIPALTQGDEQLFYDSYEQNTEIPADGATLNSLEKVFNKVTSAVNGSPPSTVDKKDQLKKIQDILKSNVSAVSNDSSDESDINSNLSE